MSYIYFTLTKNQLPTLCITYVKKKRTSLMQQYPKRKSKNMKSPASGQALVTTLEIIDDIIWDGSDSF